MQKILIALFITSLISDGPWATSVSAQQLVRVGYSGTGVAKNLHKTIERAGLWKKRGLDIRLIYFTSGATMAQTMVGGDLDVADSDVPAMLNAVSAGALDGKLISVYINRFPFAFVVRNEIKTPEDLKGKRLAISRFGSSSDVTTWYQNNILAEFQNRVRQAVRKHGMNETAISTKAIEEIDDEITASMQKYLESISFPAKLIQVTVGKTNPPDSVKHQRIQTASEQQRQETEKQKKLAEDQRKQAEISRASADNAYREAMQLSPEQFLRLETINMQKSVCQKDNCTFVVGNVAPIISVSK